MKFWIQMGSAVVLHGVAGLLVLVALLFVVPSITPLFAEFGATLPTATRISIALADSICLAMKTPTLSFSTFLPRVAWHALSGSMPHALSLV